MRLLLAGFVAALSLLLCPVAQAGIYWGHDAYRAGIGHAELDGTGVKDDFIPGGPGQYSTSRGVAADDQHVYWGSNFYNGVYGLRIGRAALDGTGADHSWTGASGGFGTGLGIGPGYLYWTSNNQDTSDVGRTPLVGGQQFQAMTSVFGEKNPRPCGVGVDDTYVYWANYDTATIGRAKLDKFGQAGQEIEGNWIQLPAGEHPCGLAVDANHVYWGTSLLDDSNGYASIIGTSIKRANKDGSGAGVFITGAYRPMGVAVDGKYLYWSNYGSGQPDGGSIGRALLTGGDVSTGFVTGLPPTWGVAVTGGGPLESPPATPVYPSQAPYVAPPSAGVSGTPGGKGPSTYVTLPSFPVPPAVRDDVWRPGNQNTASSAARRGVPRGTVFTFSLDGPAAVRVAMQQRTAGRRGAGGRCAKPTRKLRTRKACTRWATWVTLTRRADAGANRLPFTGRVGGRKMKPGRWRAVFTARRAGVAGARSASVAFRVVR